MALKRPKLCALHDSSLALRQVGLSLLLFLPAQSLSQGYEVHSFLVYFQAMGGTCILYTSRPRTVPSSCSPQHGDISRPRSCLLFVSSVITASHSCDAEQSLHSVPATHQVGCLPKEHWVNPMGDKPSQLKGHFQSCRLVQ
jgi:hypothetical protein